MYSEIISLPAREFNILLSDELRILFSQTISNA